MMVNFAYSHIHINIHRIFSRSGSDDLRKCRNADRAIIILKFVSRNRIPFLVTF
jgi:hypothetical protein